MSPPLDLTIPLPDLGELLAKRKKAGTLGKKPTLAEIMKAQEMNDPRKAKEGLLEGMRRVYTGVGEAEKEFDEIFHRGKRHPSADRLYAVGTDLGMMWLAGIRGGWQSLDDIMAECHIEDEEIAKKYIMEGLIAIVGKAEAKIAWKRIFPRVQYADVARLEARALGWQQKMGTLNDPDTLIDYTHVFGATNTRTVRNLFIEAMTDLFGEEEGKVLCAEIFPHTLNPKIIELLRLEGRQLAELWRHNGVLIYPTLTDYMRFYEVNGRDVVSRYISEGMGEILTQAEREIAYDELFSQKRHLNTEQKDSLREVGHELGRRYEKGERTTSYVLYKLMDKLGVRDIRTAKRHILLGLQDVLGNVLGNIALETYFSNVHPNAEAIRQYATDLAHQVDAGTVQEYRTLDELGEKFNASAETTSKYVYEAFILAYGEKKGEKLYEKAFPHDLYAVLGVYNHPILEAGLTEVVTSNFEISKHAPTIATEKLEGNVKHDVLIENIQEGGWFQKQLARLAPQNTTFLETLKLTVEASAKYKRFSIDLMTREDFERVREKNEKYADEETFLVVALTNYNDPDKDTVRAPNNQPNTRVTSAEFVFRLLGGQIPAIELVRKVRNLTRQGKVEELREWKQKVDIGTAPSFLAGQQSLDQWLEVENEAGEAAEEEGDPDEKEVEKDKGKATGEKPPEKAREKAEEEPERTSVGQEPASNTKNELRRTEQVHDGDRQGKSNLKIGPGKHSGREPEKEQNSLGPAEMQLGERSPGEIGTGQLRATGETAGQEIEADAGSLATSLVPPPMENPAQETMPLDELETGLAGENEVAVGTVPPAVTENAEKITPDQESSELPVDKSRAGEQARAGPAAFNCIIAERPTKETPLPPPPLTEVPAPVESPVEVIEAENTKEIQESLPSAPQIPMEEKRVLEEPLTESPLLARAEIAERPTGDGKNPSELDVPLIESKQPPVEKSLEIPLLEQVIEDAGIEPMRDDGNPNGESQELSQENSEGGSITPEQPDPFAEIDAQDPYEMPFDDARMDKILEEMHEWLEQHPEMFRDDQDFHEYPEPQGEIPSVPFDRDQLDAMKEKAEAAGDPAYIDLLREEIINNDGQEILNQMDQEADANEDAFIDAVETPEPVEELEAARQEIMESTGYDHIVDEALEGSQEHMDELIQDVLDDGGPALLEQLDQEALDPANQLPEVPEDSERIEETETEATHDAPEKTPEAKPDAPAESSKSNSTPDHSGKEASSDNASQDSDSGDNGSDSDLERSLVVPPKVPEGRPQHDQSGRGKNATPESAILDGQSVIPANPDIPDYDRLYQKSKATLDFPHYDRAPTSPDAPRDVPDYDRLPGDKGDPTDLPDYDQSPEDVTPSKDIPEYDVEPREGTEKRTKKSPEEILTDGDHEGGQERIESGD